MQKPRSQLKKLGGAMDDPTPRGSVGTAFVKLSHSGRHRIGFPTCPRGDDRDPCPPYPPRRRWRPDRGSRRGSTCTGRGQRSSPSPSSGSKPWGRRGDFVAERVVSPLTHERDRLGSSPFALLHGRALRGECPLLRPILNTRCPRRIAGPGASRSCRSGSPRRCRRRPPG